MTTVANLDDVKKWVKVTGDGDDALLTSLQPRMVDAFEQLTGINLGTPASSTRTYNGTGTKTLYLAADTTSVSAVETRETFSGSWDGLVSTFGTDIEFSSRGPKILRLDGGIFPRGKDNLRVTGSHGFANTPPEIVQAILEMVEASYRNRSVAIPTLIRDGTEVQILKPFSQHVKRTIARYRFGVGY